MDIVAQNNLSAPTLALANQEVGIFKGKLSDLKKYVMNSIRITTNAMQELLRRVYRKA